MYHKPRMCRTCLQMSRGDFKFVNLDSVDPLWESNSPNLKEQLIYIVPEMKLETTETYICTSCFIALRTAYEFKRMCQVTEQKFQNHNYKYRRPFGVGPGSPQFHVTLNENCNNSASTPANRCQNLNYLQTDTSIDITEHHLYDASKVLPRKQLAYLNNVSQKLPEIDVEVILPQNNSDAKDEKKDKLESKDEAKFENKLESKPEKKLEKVQSKTETPLSKKIETHPASKVETQPPSIETQPPNKIETKVEGKTEIKTEKINDSKNETNKENTSEKEEESGTTKEPKTKLVFPNLPGIEFLPKKLDSLELRKKYNIGSQISILKTPKQNSNLDNILKKACEEIPYLKTNNILPDALNCSIRLEVLTSQLTARVTAEKYKIEELEEIAKSYYAGCTDTLLNCQLCDRSFSTEHWLKIHEEDHAKSNQAEKAISPQLPTATPTVELIPKTNEDQKIPISVQTDTTSRIAIPIQLQNDQISITPIQKSNTTKPSVTKTFDKPIETTAEPEISLSTVKKSNLDATLPAIAKSSEISFIKTEAPTSTETETEKIFFKSEEPYKDESNNGETSNALDTPFDRENLLIDQTLLKQEIDASPLVPEDDPNQSKKLWKKNKLVGLRYQKCFICFKSFRSKLSLYHHCKFVHIPNILCSNYWATYISYLKAEKREKQAENAKNKLVEYEEEVEEEKDVVEETLLMQVRPKRFVSNQFICNICDKRVKEESLLALHMYVHTPTFVSMDPESRSDESVEIFRCYLCEKVFPKERYLKLHNLQVHLTKLVVCKICNREFKSEFWFSRHKCVVRTEVPEPEEEIEEEGKEFSCTLCDRKFARLRFMKSHRKRMHKNLLSTPAEDDPLASTQDRNDSEESEHSGYESNHENDLPADTKLKIAPENALNNLNEFASRRRSLSRGVPKIQCDFCGEYIEETAYDKHIFEHNKLRLNRSISKRKSLETNLEEAFQKKEVLLKCHVCYKSFKRRHNLRSHMTKHEDVENVDQIITEMSSTLSEAEDTLEDETEPYLSDIEASQPTQPRTFAGTIYVRMSVMNGFDTYTCCNRMFRLKAHFFRHFKKKHIDCEAKFIKNADELENSIDRDVTETMQLNISADQAGEPKSDVKLDDTETADDASIDSKLLEDSNSNAACIVENSPVVGDADSTVENTVDVNTENEIDNKPKKRKWTRRTYSLNKKDISLRNIPKSNFSADDEDTFNTESSVPLISTNNVNKRKLSLDEDIDDPSNSPKLIKKSDVESESGEDHTATTLHLRQLDLLPIANKTLGGYECHVCEKKFRQKCQLRDHFNVHTGDKPYKCDFCKPVKGFTQTSSLYVHFRRVHAVVTKNCSWEVYSKNGDCLVCSDVFFKHSQMFDHMKAYYVENEFECHVCNQKFSMTCHFKTHDIAPEDMRHLFNKNDVSPDEDDEALVENETDEKLQSDTDTIDRVSGTEDNGGEEPVIRCSKCDKTFVDKQQLRFHKKSLAHFQQIQAKRRKTKATQPDEEQEEGEEADSSVKNDATDTIEDIENGVKAIIKKIRTFKKHRCNICGSSFIRRMQLKKHKRTHKLRRSKNVSVDNLDETTTLELQDASELNQFIHDDNLSDDEEDEDGNNEMDVEQNFTEDIADSTMNSLEQQPVSSTSSDNSSLNKVDLPSNLTKDNLDLDHNLDVEDNSEDVDVKIPEITADSNELKLETSTADMETCLPEASTNSGSELNEAINDESIMDETFDVTDVQDNQSFEPEIVTDCVKDTTTLVDKIENVSDDLGQSEEVVDEDTSLDNIQTLADHISRTNESAFVSKECDVQSVSQPNLLKTNDLVFIEQNSISDENKCLGLDK
ncbi:hypothetical protein FQR65_LT09244 [Abscondita terminalis]|nr:hypothetical protein FQR65_LT09244 [Abscondita terminalis]